jgi:uncharacterized protein (DUF4415 family)
VKKKSITYGNVEVPEDSFRTGSTKVRVTMMVDMATLKAFRDAAERLGLGYQTLMNQKLGEAAKGLSNEKTLEERLRAIENEVSALKNQSA